MKPTIHHRELIAHQLASLTAGDAIKKNALEQWVRGFSTGDSDADYVLDAMADLVAGNARCPCDEIYRLLPLRRHRRHEPAPPRAAAASAISRAPNAHIRLGSPVTR